MNNRCIWRSATAVVICTCTLLSQSTNDSGCVDFTNSNQTNLKNLNPRTTWKQSRVYMTTRVESKPRSRDRVKISTRVKNAEKFMETVQFSFKSLFVYFAESFLKTWMQKVGNGLFNFYVLDFNPLLVNTPKISTWLSCKHSLTEHFQTIK